MAKKNNKSTVGKIINYVKKYKLIFIISVIFAIISVGLQLYIPILNGDAIDLILGKGNVNFAGITAILIRMAVVIAVSALFQWIMSMLNNKIVYNVVRDIRIDSIKKLQKIPFSYIDSRQHGATVSRIIADTDQFSDGLIMGFTQLITSAITILGTLVFMFTINIVNAVVVVALTPLSLFMARFIANRTHSLFKKQAEIRSEQTSLINEMIGNQKVVNAYSQEEKIIRSFEGINERLEKVSLGATFISSLTNPATRVVNNTIYAIIGIVGAFSVVSGGMSVGTLSSFLSYASQYTKPFNEISGVVSELQNALTCAARVFEFIEEEEEVPETVEETIESFDGNVNISNVKFSYNKERELIKNLSIAVKPGQRIAIVGPTGCGKTTLINLLMRFYDVDGGEISVSGVPIRKLSRNNLRSGYGMVLQDTWLHSGTIKENIAFGKKDATDEEIIEAAKKAHAHSFIMRLEKGYDTLIGEGGGNLSQGQKQLLCITRVMLALPPMLILDEATSSIDTRTEIRIQKAFQLMMNGRTSFIVAHRLSTIKNADVILVMKDGNIIEQGNHKELMAKNGFYAELYSSQFKN